MRFLAPIVIVSLVLASAAFLAQPAQAQIPPTSDHTGQTCIAESSDDACHDPLPNATVRLQGGGVAGIGQTDETTKSDEDGWFAFTNIPDGSYTVTVERTGFESMSRDITLPDDGHAFYHLPGKEVSVAGTVRDADGQAIPGAYVSMWGVSGGAEAQTGADGAFQVRLSAGMYEVQVESKHHGYQAQRMLVDGAPLALSLGSLPGQDAAIEGRVVDQDGRPVPDVDVIIRQWQAPDATGSYRYGDFRNVTQTDADGRYAAAVYAGDADVQFRKEGHSEVYRWVEVGKGDTTVLDVEMVRFPEKTARLQGSVVDAAGDPVGHVSITIEHPEYGVDECSIDQRHGGVSYDAAEPHPDVAYSEPYYAYHERCTIQVHSDGTFTGNATPGYSVLRVWYDRWAACDETHHADGSYERECGPDYFSYAETLVLEAEADNPITVQLRQRPGPDASISGYVVDREAQTAIPDAWISFDNQETNAYGSAGTDDDGSYKIRLRSGYHQVSVWADGYLPWQGVVHVPSGGEMPFDVVLTEGESRYGGHGCCYAHAEDTAVAYAGGGDSDGGSSGGSDDSGGMAAEEVPAPAGRGGDYEDLGGGLGPYDPQARAEELSQSAETRKGIPLPWPVAAVGLLAAVVLRRR